jgi:hypothetical protein|tara:strand:- start:502 stop:1221 length:720 start_codon:yes stop_codon:yes gene_type:complete
MPANMKKAGIKYNKGGSLKPIPSGNKGLPKLPTAVRNKMGYMQKGGGLKPIPSGNKGLPKLPRSVRNKMGYVKKGSEIKYGKGGTYNYKNFKNAKGQEVPGMYAQDGNELPKLDSRIADLQAKSDSVRNVLSDIPNYPGNPNMLERTPGNEVNVPGLSMEEIYDVNPSYEPDTPIDPLNMTEEEMSEFDEDFSMGNKYNTSSPKIASYREMKEYDRQIEKLKSGKRKGGSTGRGPNGIL